MTVVSPGQGVNTDVVIECRPEEPVGHVLDNVGAHLSLYGSPSINGVEPERTQPVGSSDLREGATLHYGGGAVFAPAATADKGMVLRVVSGPDAGLARPVQPGDVIPIGRDPRQNTFVLTDPDVSARHSVVRIGGSSTIEDAGSR